MKIETRLFINTRKIIFTMVLSSLLAESGFAAKSASLPQAEEPNLESRLIQRNIQLSQWFDGMAEGLDLFLVGRRITRTRNETKVVLENITFSEERRSLKNNFVLGIFPRLPNLEKYWALKFTSFDEREDRRRVNNNFIRETNRRTNYGATAAWYRRFGKVRTSFEPRIELQDPLRISHSLSFESIAEFRKTAINPKLELYASARRGPGVFQALNFNFALSKKFLLTWINEGDYQDKARLYSVNNGLVLGHFLTKKSTLSYNFIINSINRPVYHLDGYTASISYNELVYTKVFDYTLTPYITWVRANDFKGQVGAILNLRVTF